MQNVGLYQLGIFLHAKGKDSPVTGLAAKTKKTMVVKVVEEITVPTNLGVALTSNRA